jgi:4'-phosphopantetheinyl transferase
MIIGIKKIIKDENIKNLTYKEINELDSINSEKRKMEKSFSYGFIEDMLEEYEIRNYQIKKDQLGKPYLNHSEKHFNISHSNEYLACVVSDNDVGIDIEIISDKAKKVAKRFLHPDELQIHIVKHYNNEELTTLWTIKEAYSKLIGLGLTKPFDTLKVLKNNGFSVVIDGDKKGFVKTFKHEEYIISVASYKLEEITNEIKIY